MDPIKSIKGWVVDWSKKATSALGDPEKALFRLAEGAGAEECRPGWACAPAPQIIEAARRGRMKFFASFNEVLPVDFREKSTSVAEQKGRLQVP